MCRKHRLWLGTLLLAAVLTVGVSTSFGSSRASTPGVTDKLITLGLNVAQSGQAAPITLAYIQGIQTFWFDQNAHGGVCGRQVKLIYGDNGGNPQQGVTVYTQMSPQVLAFQQFSPSAVLLALAQQWSADNIMVSGSSTASALYGLKNYIPISEDWGHATINTVDWLMKHGKLKKGETIGMLHGVGAYGDDGENGAKFAAKTFGVKLVDAQVAATDTDMSAAMLAFKQADVKVAFLVALAPQQNAAIAAAESTNFHPIYIAASFLPTALGTSLASALKSPRYYVMGNGGGPSVADLSSTAPLVKKAIATYTRFFHKSPTDSSVLYGYAQAYIYFQGMKAACGAGTGKVGHKVYKPLTRTTLANAFGKIKKLDMQGLMPTLDFTLGAKKLPPALGMYLSQVDQSVVGSLKPVTPFFQAAAAKQWTGG